MSVTYITADEAKAAIRRCAFETGEVDPDGNNPRRVVHCFMGTLGADWDEGGALAAIDRAHVHDGVPQIGWMDSLFGRCLAVIEEQPDGGRRRLQFDTVTEEQA